MDKLKQILPPYVKNALERLSDSQLSQLTEIRLRIGKPVYLYIAGSEYAVSDFGIGKNDGIVFSKTDAAVMWRRLCEGAPYSCTEKQRQGYITVEGNRGGFCGEFAFVEGEIKHIDAVSSFCVRISHQIKGCGNKVYKYLFENNRPVNTLIISPPGCGKTTLLRDIARLLSGDGFNVAIADEREEIAAVIDGVPTLDVGKRTDVFSGCPKAAAIQNMVRSIRPDVIIADELGTAGDAQAIKKAMTEGVAVISTAHGNAPERTVRRLGVSFERYILLDNSFGIGTVSGVYEENMKRTGSFPLCC